jgi:hypothetical protein
MLSQEYGVGRYRAINLSTLSIGAGLPWHCRRIATVVQLPTHTCVRQLTTLNPNLFCSISYTMV